MANQPMNGSKYQVLLAIGLFTIAALPLPLRAQNAEPAKPEAPAQQQPMATTPVVRTESRVVLVDAVVTDKKGNYVHDLTQKGLDLPTTTPHKDQLEAVTLRHVLVQ